jgi:hypothetical protein
MIGAIQSAPVATPLVIPGAHQRLGQALISLLAYAASKGYPFAEYVWSANRMMRYMTYNSLYIPDDGKVPVSGQYEVQMIGGDAAFSALAYADFNGRMDIPVPLDIIHMAWRANEDINSLIDQWHLVSEFMFDDIFGRKDLLMKAFSYVNDSTGLVAILKGRLLAMNDQISVKFPDRSMISPDFADRRAMVERFLAVSNIGYRLAPELIYKFNADARRLPGFARVIDYTPIRPVWLTYSMLQDQIANETYASLLQGVRANGQTLVIRSPIPYEIENVNKWEDAHESALIMPTETSYLALKNQKYRFTYDDVIIDDTRKEVAERTYNQWGVDIDPFIAHDFSFVRGLFNHIEVDKENLKFVTHMAFHANQ